MRLDLYSLKLFVAVVDEGTIAGASEREHIASSALSKRIAELERAVGVPLLNRKSRGVEPTMAGRSLASRARDILHATDHLVDEIREFSQGVQGHVRVAANLSAITQFLPCDIRDFQSGNPGVHIELEERISTAVIKAVAENAADLGICSEESVGGSLETCHYRQDSLVLLVPERHPLAQKQSVAFADTLMYEYIGMHKGSSINALLTRAARDARTGLRMRLFATAFDTVVAMVKAGLGIGVMPVGAIEQLYRVEGMRMVRLEDGWASRNLVLCMRSRAGLAPAARHLLEHFVTSGERMRASSCGRQPDTIRTNAGGIPA